MPVDIIFYLARHHLPPVSAKALSVSCKRLRAVVPMQNCLPLSDCALEEYLPLLEKDYGGNHYYCHTCRRLHPFDPEMTSALETDPFLPPWDDDKPCLVLNSVHLDGSAVTISFHHIRLVINRHLHKPPAGLPLSIFRLDNPSSPTSTRTPLRWHQSWSARIIDNELFLRCTRTLCSPGAGRVITARAARDAIDDGDYRICKHVAAQWRHTPFVVEALQRPSDEVDEEVCGGDDGLFTPCSEMPESCERCLTDIVTTVECGGDDEEEECRITLTSWHRLGGGRSPGDERWRMFESGGDELGGGVVRDARRYANGEVRRVWMEDEAREGRGDGG